VVPGPVDASARGYRGACTAGERAVPPAVPRKSTLVFRRSKTTAPSAAVPAAARDKVGGKGRPTPSRKEAEAAARARVKGPSDKKEAARLQRQRRSENNARMREGMRSGDDRYLPTRDKGPVRRFARDFIDARLCVSELLLPLLVLIMISGAFSPRLSSSLWSVTILLIALDTSYLIFRLRRELNRRFASRDVSTKGAVGYAVLRAIQLRWLRMPKPQVKLGARLPERY
jgi:hypothetical protein